MPDTDSTAAATSASPAPAKPKKPAVPEPQATKQKFLNAAERAKVWGEDMADWAKQRGDVATEQAVVDACAAAQASLSQAESALTSAANALAGLPAGFKPPADKRESAPVEYILGGKYRLRGNTAKLEPTAATKNVEITKLYGEKTNKAQVSYNDSEKTMFVLVPFRDLGPAHAE